MTREEFLDKCIAFSVRINKLRKYLRTKHHEYNNSDQIQRSGTSIGANYSEACNAESTADFVHKTKIALKECHETNYWLTLLHKTDYIDDKQFEDLDSQNTELRKMLIASINKLKDNG